MATWHMQTWCSSCLVELEKKTEIKDVIDQIDLSFFDSMKSGFLTSNYVCVFNHIIFHLWLK